MLPCSYSGSTPTINGGGLNVMVFDRLRGKENSNKLKRSCRHAEG